jgi:hypothetical protein
VGSVWLRDLNPGGCIARATLGRPTRLAAFPRRYIGLSLQRLSSCTQLSGSAPSSGSSGSPQAWTQTCQYFFREVRWLQAGAPSAAEAAPPALLLLDAGRDIAIFIPVPAAGTGTCAALIGLRGVHGEFGPFHEGVWCTRL